MMLDIQSGLCLSVGMEKCLPQGEEDLKSKHGLRVATKPTSVTVDGQTPHGNQKAQPHKQLGHWTTELSQLNGGCGNAVIS